jgi:hypothetical protein
VQVSDNKLPFRVLGVGMGRESISASKLKGETGLCAEIVNFLKASSIEGKLKAGWFHVANECDHSSKTNMHYMLAKRKAMGVISGVPDFVFFWKGGNGFMEVKYKDGRLSEKQKDFYYYWLLPYEQRFSVVRSLGDVKEVLEEWGVLQYT